MYLLLFTKIFQILAIYKCIIRNLSLPFGTTAKFFIRYYFSTKCDEYAHP